MGVHRTVVLLASVVALAAPGVAGDDDEKAWSGVLPDPEPDRVTFVSKQAESQKRCAWLVVRVLDAETGHAVPGARLTRTPEWINSWRRRHDAVMSVAVTDADGIAGVPSEADAWNDACHWLVSAPGYATAYEYAALPSDEMALERGVRLTGRILDALGRPVPGARVENFGGCSHGTPAARAVTDADGVFAFEHLGLGGQFWVEGPRIAWELMAVDRLKSRGTQPADVVMRAAARYEGRIVDLAGEPVPDVVVRAFSEARGPVTLAGADGRFVLEGARPGVSLNFLPPADFDIDGTQRDADDFWPDVAATVVVTPRGIQEDGQSAIVEVRTVRADGAPAADVSFRLVREDNGRGPSASTADEDDPPAGAARVEVAPGAYRVLPNDPFGAWTFDAVTVTASAEARAAAVIVVRAQPRLRIAGDVPQDADLVLAVALPGRQATTDDVGGETDRPMPADCPASLRVTPKDGPPFFFPVGPAKDGFRDVRVEVPPPRRIVLPTGAKYPKLLDGPREVLAHETPSGFETWAIGRFTVGFTDADGVDVRAIVDLTAVEPGAELAVDPASPVPLVEETVVRLVGPGDDGTESELDRKEVEPGRMVVFRDDGRRTMRAVAPPSGEIVLRLGTAALRLTVRDAAGAPVDALTLVDGEIYAAPEGTLEIAGFDAGTIGVVVARRDARGGVELRLVLDAGQTRERTVTLPE